jgi:hypothetical protein
MGRRRVAPEPTYGQKVMMEELQKREYDGRAPWSGPRGYDTTIREEAFAFKAVVKDMRRQEREATMKKQVVPEGNPKKRMKKTRSWHLRQLLPVMPELRIKERFTRFVGTIFCMRAEVDAYIQATKVDRVDD